MTKGEELLETLSGRLIFSIGSTVLVKNQPLGATREGRKARSGRVWEMGDASRLASRRRGNKRSSESKYVEDFQDLSGLSEFASGRLRVLDWC